MIEEWRPAVGFEGYYEVSDQGRIRSLDRTVEVRGRWGLERRTYAGKILRQHKAGTARYLGVCLCAQSKLTTHLVHDVVLRAFVGPPAADEEARHLNCENYDNRAENLAWGSRHLNREDSRRHGKLALGERIAQHKLTAADVLAVRAAAGRHDDIANKFGVSRTQVSRIKRGENWAHV